MKFSHFTLQYVKKSSILGVNFESQAFISCSGLCSTTHFIVLVFTLISMLKTRIKLIKVRNTRAESFIGLRTSSDWILHLGVGSSGAGSPTVGIPAEVV